jgi:hypothetical protein
MINYTSSPKLTWRGWVWNRITERISKLDRPDAIVLYLVGPNDLDREIAIRKGFKSKNLIAIDRDEECVKAARRIGSLAIQATLEDLLVAWPKDLPISAVLADFTCGLDKVMNFFQGAILASRAIHPETVIAVNLQRGRDPASNPLREGLRAAKKRLSSGRLDNLYSDEFNDIFLDELHRGKQLYSNFLYHCMMSFGPDRFKTMLLGFSTTFLQQTKPVFYSYRQKVGMPYMDSVVFSMPYGKFSGLQSELLEIYKDWRKLDPEQLYNRKIAALRAVRTKK